MNQTHFLSIFEHIGIWGSAVVPILFFIQYTILAKWWRNAVGRSIVALDFCIELVAAPLLVAVVEPGWVAMHPFVYGWILVAGLCGVPLIALYRMLSWEKLRRNRKSLTENGIK